MHEIQYIPLESKKLGKIWRVRVFSDSVKDLREIKKELNEFSEQGTLVIENTSKAIKRLGWKELDGIYYRHIE